MRRQTLNAFRTASFQSLASVGAASGSGNRARTIPSKRDKQRDPRAQRRAFNSGRLD